MLRRLVTRLVHRPGDRHDGPACYCDDYAIVAKPGFYALDQAGKTVNPHLRLIYVDDAPGDPDDGSGHYEVAGRKDPIQKPGERVVELAVKVKGSSELTPGIRQTAIRDPEATLDWLDSEACALSPDARAILRELAERELR